MSLRSPTEHEEPAFDRGRERLSPSPPSEPCVRFSRTRLSSRWLPHRDWLVDTRIQRVNNRCAAKRHYLCPPLPPFPPPPTCAQAPQKFSPKAPPALEFLPFVKPSREQ